MYSSLISISAAVYSVSAFSSLFYHTTHHNRQHNHQLHTQLTRRQQQQQHSNYYHHHRIPSLYASSPSRYDNTKNPEDINKNNLSQNKKNILTLSLPSFITNNNNNNRLSSRNAYITIQPPSPSKPQPWITPKQQTKRRSTSLLILGSTINEDKDEQQQQNNNNANSDEPKIVKSNFDAFFNKDMPSLQDIVSGGGDSNNQVGIIGTSFEQTASKDEEEKDDDNDDDDDDTKTPTLPPLSTAELQEINDKYTELYNQMEETFQQEISEEESTNTTTATVEELSESAKNTISLIVQERKEKEIHKLREWKANQVFKKYELQQLKLSQKVAEEDDETARMVLEQILEETTQENKTKQELQNQLNDYQDYESLVIDNYTQQQQREQLQQRLDTTTTNSSTTTSTDFDKVQLEIMKELLQKTQRQQQLNDEYDDEEDDVIDLYENIERGIKELQMKIESNKTDFSSTSLKEWQMYRAVATKLEDSTASNTVEDNLQQEQLRKNKLYEKELEDPSIIEKQVQSWKEFLMKEEIMRQKAGLAITRRLPFEWMNKNIDDDTEIVKTATTSKSRYEMDIMALKLLRDLMENTVDLDRKQKLSIDIENLADEVERKFNSGDYNVTTTPKTDKNVQRQDGPVDVSSIFQSSTTNEEEETKGESTRTTTTATTKAIVADPSSIDKVEEIKKNVDDLSSTTTYNINDTDDPLELGTFEEQDFRALLKRSGVQTEEEKEQLRSSWENFRSAEQAMRKNTGLSNTDDDDDDDDSVITTIDEKKEKKDQQQAPETPFFSSSKDDVDIIISNNQVTQWDRSSYTDQMFRSVGGAEQKNKTLQDENKAAFEEYLKKENKMRQSFEDKDIESKNNVTLVDDDTSHNEIDFDTYAENALSSLGSRPKVKEREKDIKPRSASSRTSDDEDDSRASSRKQKDDEDSNTKSKMRKSMGRSSVLQEQMPDWLRREIVDVRGEEFDITDDDTKADNYVDYDDDDDDDEKYRKNERQAEEFGAEKLGITKAIDVGSILGRDVFSSEKDGLEEYNDEERRLSDEFSSFEARKKNLMEYTVLTVADINALMDHKRPSVGNVNPYASKTKFPLIEYASIFRLEGVLVNVSGLSYKAWKKTAEKHNLKPPTVDNVKYASVHHEAFAIKKIFYWGDDIVTNKEIVKTYHEVLLIEFEEWMKENSITEDDTHIATTIDSSNDEEESSDASRENDDHNDEEENESSSKVDDIPLSSADLFKLQVMSWKKVAQKYSFDAPTVDMVQIGSTLDPNECLRAVFLWTDDVSLSKEMTGFYKRNLSELTNALMKIKDSDSTSTTPGEDKIPDATIKSDDLFFNIRLYGWKIAAEKHDFSPPLVDDVHSAALVEPTAAVRDVMCWTKDENVISDIVSTYKKACKVKSDEYIENSIDTPDLSPQDTKTVTVPPSEDKNSLPRKADFIQLELKVWEKVSKKFNYNAPTLSEVYAANVLGPEKAVTSVFEWTSKVAEVDSAVEMFNAEFKKVSKKLVKKVQNYKRKLSDKEPASETEEAIPFFVLNEGVTKWLKALNDANMPIVIASYMPSKILNIILRETGLSEFFPIDKRVSSSCGYQSEIQQILGGALRAERRTDKSLLFSSTPQSAVNAHDVMMKNIAIVRPYPYYELTSADMTLRDFETIRLKNMEAIFTDRGFEDMQQLQLEGPDKRVNYLRKTKFWDDD